MRQVGMRLQLIFAYRPLPFCRQVGLLASPRRPKGVVDSAMDGGRVSYGSKVVTRVAVHTTCFRTTPLFGPND